jgi:hypothetical protein
MESCSHNPIGHRNERYKLSSKYWWRREANNLLSRRRGRENEDNEEDEYTQERISIRRKFERRKENEGG